MQNALSMHFGILGIPLSGRFPANLAAVAAAMLVLTHEVFAAASGAVTLAWNANPEPNLAGYRLKYGTSPGNYPNSVDAGNAITATANGLNQGTVYYFVVVAYNSAGQTSAPSAVVSHTVPGKPNTPPSAASFAVTVVEDGQVAATLSGTDAEGSSLGFTVVTAPAKGTLTGSGPNLTYRPTANATGSDSFTYRTSDGVLSSPLATVSITISAVNDAPVAIAKSVTTPRNTPVPVVLTGSDVEGSLLTYTVLTPPTKGVLSGAVPNLTYLPNPNVTGADGFTFRVFDGTSNSGAATISIEVTNFNQTPQAASKFVATMRNKQIPIQLSATDADSNPLTYRIVSQPTTGVLIGTPPRLAFRPKIGFVGDANFTYVANDGIVDSVVAMVTVKVKPSNIKPVATARTMVANWNTATDVVLGGTDADSDELSFLVVRQPLNGTLTGTPPNLVYLPKTGFRGKDQLVFVASDGLANSAAAVVSISVINPNNRAPASSSWSVSTPARAPVPVTLRATDADGDPLVYRIVTRPIQGLLVGKFPNLVFKPRPKFVGTTSFTYVANDGALDSAPITVTINVGQSLAAARVDGEAKGTGIIETLPEMSLKTDPSRPGILGLKVAGSPGKSYSLEHSADLTRWAFDREIVIGEGGTVEFEMVIPSGSRGRFYRLSMP